MLFSKDPTPNPTTIAAMEESERGVMPDPDPFDLCVMIVEEECYLDSKDFFYSSWQRIGRVIRDRIRCAQRDQAPTKPVAWLRTWADGVCSFVSTSDKPQEVSGTTLTPLYTSSVTSTSCRPGDQQS